MCRWMAYTGNPVPLETLLFKPKHNLIDQSLTSRSAETPTNGDGFGLGWYGSREVPGLFRSIRPAWNDFNLRDLAAQVDARLFLAHVRATSLATVQETNCHPFRYGRWLFVHNGELHEIEKYRRELMVAVSPEIFSNILGTTDSELMFHLALTFGLEQDPLGGLARMTAFVERTARDHGVEESVWMTVAVTDGETIWAARYASDGEAPTLYFSKDLDQFSHLNPQAAEILGGDARTVVSEPIGEFKTLWTTVPQSSSLRVHAGEVELRSFVPAE
jgi:glutamine amidotransferase